MLPWRVRSLGAALLLAGLCLPWALQAQTPPPPSSSEAPLASADPALEKRVMNLSAELRCLVCQNQTIADSNAELAVDLRNQVRDMLSQGQTDAQVLEFMTERYGDFVLYRPPLNANTALLWFGPALLLVGGVATLWLILYRRSRMAPEAFEPDEDDLPAEQPAPGERAASPASSAKT
jgi:cytochrome c-type biogenesis protein CcmH